MNICDKCHQLVDENELHECDKDILEDRVITTKWLTYDELYALHKKRVEESLGKYFLYKANGKGEVKVGQVRPKTR